MEIREEKKISICNAVGFTLVELLITMVISGIIAGALYSTYQVQQHSYTNQEAVAEMQQNIRAALMVMSRDIRMAGYDPQSTGNYKITTATGSKLVFSADLNEDGGSPGMGETMTYELYTPPGASLTALRRIAGQAAIAENIEKIEFLYLDGSGATTSVPADIHAVRVSILARASRPDRKFMNTRVYTPASGVPWDLNGAAAGNAANDNFRRRLLITTIQCRNMGL